MATPPTFPISKASFFSNTYTFDPLYADETIAQSANIAGALGVLVRGTVLCGPAPGTPVTQATLLTTVVTGAQARFILAQDIDTTGGQVTGVVYSQGKFLDTAMTFTSQGAALDVAQLRQFGIYVLTVEQRSGILVPAMKLPATGGPLPQALSPKDAAQASKEEVAAIKAAIAAWTPPPEPPQPRGQEPAWAIAAFGEPTLTPEDQARQKAAQDASDLAAKQQKALADLEAKQAKETSDLQQQQQEERAQFVQKTTDALKQTQAQTPPPAAPTYPGGATPPKG
jgi:hypothetical protein